MSTPQSKVPAYVDAPAPAKKIISLRERIHQPSEVQLRTQETIDRVMTRTAAPFEQGLTLQSKDLLELEASLSDFHNELVRRERDLNEKEIRLRERERTLWENEALLTAKESILRMDAARGTSATIESPFTDSALALDNFREELKRQEDKLRRDREQLREREAFIELSENTLFDKAQALEERAAQVEQAEEDLRNQTARRA
jgi:hypothetical protein